MKPQAILCDRDGTLIQDSHFLNSVDQIEWIHGVLDTLKLLKNQGIKVLVISNQSGVARGYFGIETVEAINAKMRDDAEAVGGEITDFYYCPHHPQGEIGLYSSACNCRKPAPGMFLQAIKDYNLNPSLCWAIGDRLRDIEPALQLGAKPILVKTGYGLKAHQELLQNNSDYAKQVKVISALPEIINLLK